ncbi:hypothetical protein PY479_06670 [Shewanella sp. A32]|uniref:hypothetical protein n=1 Tax=Shewanella sp. A32 TaxID=3031327 RepID=UPI0023B9B00A|nr:hypothetical protein [Shewanella sp. A32]MDF0533957.1 hypothetical protein [Shewanella sp. A32]
MATAQPYKFFAVTSLSHSGSTVFSMALACHPQLISLGEVLQVLRQSPSYWLDDPTQICSCGKQAAECSFWGKVLHALPPGTPVGKAYLQVMKEFQHQYGSEMFMVDTSKGFRHLQLMADQPQLEPFVLFLMRDVRSFICAQTRPERSAHRRGLKKIKNRYWFQMLRWYFGNRLRERFMLRHHLAHYQLSYEQFCFDAAGTLSNIYKQMGLAGYNPDDAITQSQHHILMGNNMCQTKERCQNIRYDHRWLKEDGYLMSASLLPFVMRYNKQYIYR